LRPAIQLPRPTTSGLDRLEKLVLSHTAISDAGLVHLKKLHHLKWLDISSDGVGDAGLAYLYGLRQLEYLNLMGSQVTHPAVQGLGKVFKTTHIDAL
jgi:hypothetical protein